MCTKYACSAPYLRSVRVGDTGRKRPRQLHKQWSEGHVTFQRDKGTSGCGGPCLFEVQGAEPTRGS